MRISQIRRRWLLGIVPVLAAATLLGVSALPANAALLRQILADGSTVTWMNGHGAVQDSGESYNIATKQYPGPDVHLPIVTTAAHYQGLKSLEFLITPYSGTQKPGEKTMIDVASVAQGDAPPFGQWRAISFAINLDQSFQDPPKGIMLAEWWQGGPMGPPVELTLKPGSLQWHVGIRDNATLNQGSAANYYDGAPLDRGNWHVITMAVYPNYRGNGEVKVWQDAKQVLDVNNTPVGFDPSIVPPGATSPPPDGFNISLGLYRQADVVRAQAYYDRIRYGDTYDDVR